MISPWVARSGNLFSVGTGGVELEFALRKVEYHMECVAESARSGNLRKVHAENSHSLLAFWFKEHITRQR